MSSPTRAQRLKYSLSDWTRDINIKKLYLNRAITVEEICLFLGVSRMTVYRRIKKMGLPLRRDSGLNISKLHMLARLENKLPKKVREELQNNRAKYKDNIEHDTFVASMFVKPERSE